MIITITINIIGVLFAVIIISIMIISISISTQYCCCRLF